MSIDRRFYELREGVDLAQLLSFLGLHLQIARNPKLNTVAPASMAGEGALCFHTGRDADAADVSPSAAACFVTADAAPHLPEGPVALIVDRPRAVFAEAAQWLVRVKSWPTRADPDDGAAQIADTAQLAANVVIGEGVAIGEGTRVGPGAVIGPGVQIGRNCEIGANVSLQCALLGDGVRIASGTTVGESGFGTIAGAEGAEDMPQFGRVIIQDKVTIGANCCIDRGAFDDTVIGERTKIDNLCQIGHNVRVGRSVVMAAFAGLSGTVVLEDGVMLGGRVGIADHVSVGAGARLAADAAVMRNVPAGETWGGTPAKPFSQWMRETAWLQKQVRAKRRSDT